MQNFFYESFISPLIIIPMQHACKKGITMDENTIGSEHSSKEQIVKKDDKEINWECIYWKRKKYSKNNK